MIISPMVAEDMCQASTIRRLGKPKPCYFPHPLDVSFTLDALMFTTSKVDVPERKAEKVSTEKPEATPTAMGG